ncbi:MAG: Gfo/Idh/MocA family oxidoreductase [Chloroflexi bacterium]|nr:Gfo/Idh/MocA family oxidoreductase [Chloroflexota bacterium]
MAEQKIRVGIIGANVSNGWGPRAHLPALLALPEFELAAVCTSRPETAAASKQKFGARLAFHDYHEMVRRPDIDVVSVVVRVPYHYEMTMAALNAGKHVFTEWPLGANLAQAEEMANLARAKGVRTMAGMQRRCAPIYLRLKELIEEGYIGEVVSCHLSQMGTGGASRTSDRTWMADVTKGANTMTISFGHLIDVLSMCVGELKDVSAVVSTQVSRWFETDTNRYVEVTSPDNILVSGKLASGAVVSAHVASQPSYGSGQRLEIYGREGTLVVEGNDSRLLGGKVGDASLRDLPIPERLTWVSNSVPQGPPFNVAQMYRRFGEAIRSGQRAEPDFDTAVVRHRLLDAIQRASDQGMSVRLD